MYLKETAIEDKEKIYDFLVILPADENGFENPFYNIDKETFYNEGIIKLINNSKGIGLKEGYVPDTCFFFWDNDEIVGLFKLRHCLTEGLKNGAGHIGYGIARPYRGKHYATKGLALCIEKAKAIIPEDEIYMSVNKDNTASLKVQLNNGAYIHHEDDKHYYTRIRK